jgi:hypothetical protein
MSEKWNRGVEILNNIRPDFADNPARLKDIGLAEALGIQFESGYNILRFYLLREQLFNAEVSGEQTILDEMGKIVFGEIDRSERLAELCGNDSRLGFHSEAEGYKYFPGKIKWRIAMLKNLLADDFSFARATIAKGKLEYPVPANIQTYACGSNLMEACDSFRWKADIKDNSLVFEIECEQKGSQDQLFISVSTGSTRYPLLVELTESDKMFSDKSGNTGKIFEYSGGWTAEIIIPLVNLDCNYQKSVRLNVVRVVNFAGKTDYFCWPENNHPVEYRLNLGMYNPQAAGILIIKN